MPRSQAWNDLALRLVEWGAALDPSGTVRLVLAIGSAPPVKVALRLRSVTAYGGPAVVVSAYLGPAELFDPWAVLATNNALAHGAVAFEAGILMMRQVIPIAGLDATTLDQRMRELAAEAAEIKRLLPTVELLGEYRPLR